MYRVHHVWLKKPKDQLCIITYVVFNTLVVLQVGVWKNIIPQLTEQSPLTVTLPFNHRFEISKYM